MRQAQAPVEHYISHVLDMRSVEFGTPVDFYGIQCAIGMPFSLKFYEIIRTTEKVLKYAWNLSREDWKAQFREFLGKGAESMIALEEKEQKYNLDSHRARLQIILGNWDTLLQIIQEELPTSQELEQLLNKIEAPKTLEDIGISQEFLPTIFKAAKDIRDKYVLSRLAWDLGVLEEIV